MCENVHNRKEVQPLPPALVLRQITEEQLIPIQQFCVAIGMVLNESGTPRCESETIGKILGISACFLARTLNATFLAKRGFAELMTQSNECHNLDTSTVHK
jgi:hypothetical protein